MNAPLSGPPGGPGSGGVHAASDVRAALDVPALWIVAQPAPAERRRCRDYHVCDAVGTALLSVRAFVWGRDMVARDAVTRAPMLLVRRRRLFPLTGRVDVLEPAAGRRIGTLHRSGRFVDASGRALGRFRDARSLREKTGESVFQAALEALLDGDGSSSYPSGPEGYVWIGPDGAVAGTLARRMLSFAPGSDNDHAPIPAGLRAAVAARVRGLVRGLTAPRGWLLERAAPPAGADPLLVTGAALFAVELSRW